MLQALFSSRVRLLTLFLLNPETCFYARALAQRIGAQYSAVWKELKRLEQAGVLLSESSPTSKSYYVNPRLAILPELRAIILKTVGAGDILRRGLERSGQIQAAFVYGSFAAGDADPQSDGCISVWGQVLLGE
jgi:biotin operon repressor